MPYIKSISAVSGDTMDDCIKTYLTFKSAGLTNNNTVINFNDIEYPIGYFSEENIETFELGLITRSNLWAYYAHDNQPTSAECKKHARYFADQVLEVFHDNPYTADEILTKFDELMRKSTRKNPQDYGTPMFDEEEKKRIEDAIAQRKAELGRKYYF